MAFSFPLQLLLSLLITVTQAQPNCPDDELVYSPFRPWFNFDYGPERGDCWKAAICLFDQADSARNQQFSATALVMGLLPMVFRDIAWPERRVVLVSSPLPALAEVVVRALGLEPVVRGGVAGWSNEDSERWVDWLRRSSIAGPALRSRFRAMLVVFASFFALLASYAGLALVEIYSKRSALGCVYPVIALTWCLVGVIPAAIHVVYESFRRRGVKEGSESGDTRPSAVQGADQQWPVQLSWGIYYIIGTLVYTSIMAVTPLELFVWVVTMAVVSGAGKMLALYICLMLRSPA
ncbi:hypothetical protein N7447_003220 [Penicillium robsamsonii]|uniref:uncharacterized protein n=1 Tax=Penicillium robsamsonii TaxID=1792511 RepID=UPI0025486E84|nr:uncharacterized protein N7447_003220 [Penicillium robsamsonii]KAJ5837194.1 hypothetical protein N7447_003220 [Penicillium robsamsonii]